MESRTTEKRGAAKHGKKYRVTTGTSPEAKGEIESVEG